MRNSGATFLLILSVISAWGQDYKSQLPPLDSVWTAEDYKSALAVLKTELEAKRLLPLLIDDRSKKFYERLLAVENLDVLNDKTISFEKRALKAQPYFLVFSEYLDLFSEAVMDNEATTFIGLMIEATKRVSYLYEEKFIGMPDEQVMVSRASLGTAMFEMTNGAFKLLEQNRGKVRQEYMRGLAQRLNEDFPVLWFYMSQGERKSIRGKIQVLAQSDPDKLIQKLMDELDKKLQ